MIWQSLFIPSNSGLGFAQHQINKGLIQWWFPCFLPICPIILAATQLIHPLAKTSPNFHIWSRGHWPKWSSDGEFSSESDSAGWVWHSNRFPMTTENYAKTTPNCFVTTYIDLKPLASWCSGSLTKDEVY